MPVPCCVINRCYSTAGRLFEYTTQDESVQLQKIEGYYLSRKTIRPLVKSYGDSSTRTLSPGTIRMKFFRILPATCARTSEPVYNWTRNRVFANAWVTVPSTSNASSFFPIASRGHFSEKGPDCKIGADCLFAVGEKPRHPPNGS